MTELKLKQLHRGYVLTDFDGNDIGVKDSEQAMEEIRKLVKPGEESGQPAIKEPLKKTRPNTAELHRQIFEKAKEQIDLTGKFSAVGISRALQINNSTVHSHLKKMNIELEELIKKWKIGHYENVLPSETGTDAESTNVESAKVG